MSMIRGALRGITIVTAGLILAGGALAQEGDPTTPPSPREVVANCLEHMHSIAQASTDAMHQQTREGVGTIIELAQNDARPRRILLAGDTTKAQCTLIAAHAQEALNHTLARCAHRLSHLEAPPEAFAVIHEGRRRAGHAIGEALTNCKRRVNRALARREP